MCEQLNIENNCEEVKKLEDSLAIAEAIVSALDAKKARDIKLLHVEDRTVITDYFVVCTGTSRTQVRSLADEADYQLEKCGVECLHTEGYDTGVWVLKDYGGVILHVFNATARDFYKLEKLYDGTTDVDISEIVTD
ncbi:MAG: ribosome silencing factor [Clostridia bacterium]|nr:ribosome silencing factor [Clostridia bacterium]